jgi:uncharacterized membrane protein
MRPFKEYSVVRIIIVGFGVGIIVGALRIAVMEIFPSSAWTRLVTGVITGIVLVAILGYFSTGGRNKQLLRKDADIDRVV